MPKLQRTISVQIVFRLLCVDFPIAWQLTEKVAKTYKSNSHFVIGTINASFII